jgi:hypothetical protein
MGSQPRGLLLGGSAAALLGATWIALGALGISELVVGRYAETALLLAAAVVLASFFQRVFRWHVGRMDQ